MTAPTKELLRDVVQLACQAPSVHNTQPWRWRIRGASVLELRADRNRQLNFSDPEGRNLVISCGAAAHHAVVAARGLGLAPRVTAMPSPDDSDLLARIEFSPGRPPQEALRSLDLLQHRRTDRRRFTSWPIPESRLSHLAEAAAGWGAFAVPVVEPTSRFRTELLVNRALSYEEADERFAKEQDQWIEHSPYDGVPSLNAAPAVSGRPGERPNRYVGNVDVAPGGRLVESTDGLVAICTARDDQLAWFETGEALSALWLRATQDGLSIVPLSQVLEVAETRAALYEEVFGEMAHPQVLVRVGWQEIARTTLPQTPRRPLDQVLED